MTRLLVALGLLSAMATSLHAQPPHTFEVKGGEFVLDGKPFQVLAGEIHYLRVPEAYWRHRIRMAKAMGLNTIGTYVFWNAHEPKKGRWNFAGDANLRRFVQTCQEEGMWVILRPGPYACAEWEFGGYPYWLLNEPDLAIRTTDPKFLELSRTYLKQIAAQTRDLQITRGGPIVMVQVENEYGSYGNDHAFMERNRDILREVGFDVPLFVAEGTPQLANAWVPGTVAGVNGAGWPDVKATVDKYTPGGPYIVPEHYPGWLDHWGEPKSQNDGNVATFRALVENGVSVNLYMFHGGTNFGFMNGSNYGSSFQPDLTSYDYDAPVDEAGRARAKYHALQKAIVDHTGVEPMAIPDENPVVAVRPFGLTRFASYRAALGKSVHADGPKTMEDLDQAFGFVLYRHRLAAAARGRLRIPEVRDYAVVMVDGRIVGKLDRRRKERELPIVAAAGSTLEVLVENMGRINYGRLLPENRKGILGEVLLDGIALAGWETIGLPLDDVRTVRDDMHANGPGFYRGEFELDKVADVFLDLRGWSKGVVFVNGQNLGRYWKIGPQQTLYAPGPWLRKGRNEVVVFEVLDPKAGVMSGLAAPILTDLRPENRAAKRPRAPLVEPIDLSGKRPVVASEIEPGSTPHEFYFPPVKGRFLVLQTESSHSDQPFVSLGELELLGPDRHALPRGDWKVADVDSEETVQDDSPAENLLDGDPESFWHSAWSASSPPHPHRVVIDLGSEATVGGVRLVPRQDSASGRLRQFRLFVLPSG